MNNLYPSIGVLGGVFLSKNRYGKHVVLWRFLNWYVFRDFQYLYFGDITFTVGVVVFAGVSLRCKCTVTEKWLKHVSLNIIYKNI